LVVVVAVQVSSVQSPEGYAGSGATRQPRKRRAVGMNRGIGPFFMEEVPRALFTPDYILVMAMAIETTTTQDFSEIILTHDRCRGAGCGFVKPGAVL
jgi:hypothetical protein